MKKKTVLSLLAAITAGSLLLSGCSGIDLTNISQEETTLSAEMEQENLSDGTIQLHSVWYDADNAPLASATITFLDGDDELYSGVTDENGNLEVCTLTGNTTLTCKITGSSGETLASTTIVYKISDDYESLTVYPAESGEEHVLELPSAKTDIRSAAYLTGDGEITIANISPYYESTDTSTDDGSETETTEGDAAATEGDAAATEGDAATTEGDAAATEGEAATE